MNERLIGVCVDHVAIQTAHFEKAFEYYTKILGLRILKKPFNFKGSRTLAWLDAGGIKIELYSVKNGKEPQPYDDRRVGADHIAFEVQDLDSSVAYFIKQGVKILKPPFLPATDDQQQPRIAFIEGPDGEEIEIREAIG